MYVAAAPRQHCESPAAPGSSGGDALLPGFEGSHVVGPGPGLIPVIAVCVVVAVGDVRASCHVHGSVPALQGVAQVRYVQYI